MPSKRLAGPLVACQPRIPELMVGGAWRPPGATNRFGAICTSAAALDAWDQRMRGVAAPSIDLSNEGIEHASYLDSWKPFLSRPVPGSLRQRHRCGHDRARSDGKRLSRCRRGRNGRRYGPRHSRAPSDNGYGRDPRGHGRGNGNTGRDWCCGCNFGAGGTGKRNPLALEAGRLDFASLQARKIAPRRSGGIRLTPRVQVALPMRVR